MKKQVTKAEMHVHIRRWPRHHAWSGHGEPFWSTSVEDYVADVAGSTIAHIQLGGPEPVFEIFEPSVKQKDT